MKSLIITKWIEPYKLLETIKEYYQYKDFTFDTISKNMEKKTFLKELENSETSIGLYMKNVNKFYLFTAQEEVDIYSKLTEVFGFTAEDVEISEDIDKSFDMVDMAKAEASIILS